MKIEYFSDFACPYCYIGETNLKHAIQEEGLENDIELDMKAFELDPGAPLVYTGPTVDRFARKYGLSKEDAEKRIESISQMGRDAGLDFRYKESRSTNTFNAHRLMKLAKTKGKEIADKVQELLFKAYFTDSLELADRSVLTKIGKEAGLGEKEIKDLLAGDEFAVDVRNDETMAAVMGVQGVPFFIVGSVAIPGAMPVDAMRKLLREELAKEKQPVETVKAGMSCSADGCH